MNIHDLSMSRGGRSSSAKLLPETGDPFLFPSAAFLPKNLDTALDLALFLYHNSPKYRAVTKRVIGHFITDIDISGTHLKDGQGFSEDEKNKLYDVLMLSVDIKGCLSVMGQDWASAGNSFWRVHLPFRRLLVDRRDDGLKVYDVSAFGEDMVYDWRTMSYDVRDPARPSGPRVKLPFVDLPVQNKDGVRPVSLDPRRMHVIQASASKAKKFIWEFDEEMLRRIKASDIFEVNETPRDMLKAISEEKAFQFAPGHVFHFMEPTVTGVDARGWGIPPPLLIYPDMHQAAVYKKIDEQIGMDFMMPYRVLSPDPAVTLNAGVQSSVLMHEFQQHARQMFETRRRDPYAFHSFPFPIDMKEFGASGKSLTTKDLVQYHEMSMVDNCNYPAELFNMSLRIEAVPTALRVFESAMPFIPTGFTNFVQWFVERRAVYLNEAVPEVSVQKPSMALDLENKQVYLSLMSSGEMSRAKSLRPFGITDPSAEFEERIAEDMAHERIRQEKEEEFQREMQAGSVGKQIDAAQAAQQPGASMAPGGGAASEMTPVDSMKDAQDKAMQALSIQEDGERAKFLQSIAATDKQLHLLVKGIMEEERRRGASQGRAAVGAPQQQ